MSGATATLINGCELGSGTIKALASNKTGIINPMAKCVINGFN